MTAIPTVGTLTEISYADAPITTIKAAGSAAGLRRIRVFVRVTTAAATNTLDLATYIPNIADIEGIISETIDNVFAATPSTWSTTTIAFAGHTGSGVYEGSFWCTIT